MEGYQQARSSAIAFLILFGLCSSHAKRGWPTPCDPTDPTSLPCTLMAFEAKRDDDARLMGANNRLAVEAFERAGLEFIPENGGGAGVRMRERRV